MATIKIADDIHPVKSNATGASSGVTGGIYAKGNVSRASSLDRRGSRRQSRERAREKSADLEEGEDGPPAQADDFKKRQVFKGRILLWCAVHTLN